MTSKSRIAVALAAAFGTMATGAAFAQTSTVQIGGSLNMFYSKASAGFAGGAKNHDNLSLSEPEMYIHGEEKLGGGMTAWFRCTSSFDLMGTGAGTTSGNGQLCGRNSALGFKGSFGNVFAGTWDTPHKLVGNQVRGWFGGTASLTGGFANVLMNGSGSNTGNTGTSFWERRSRSINYHSPSFSGFNVKAMYSAQNEATGLSTGSPLSPRTIGGSVEYAQGPMYFAIGYERHNDFGAVATGSEDDAWVFGARYQFGSTRLSGLYSRTEFDATATTTLKKNGYALFVDHQIAGPHSVKAQYFAAGDSKGNSLAAVGTHAAPGADTGAKGWTLAYMYDFSKRTQAGFVYGVIDNDRNSRYSKGVSASTTGAEQKVYGLNVRHRF